MPPAEQLNSQTEPTWSAESWARAEAQAEAFEQSQKGKANELPGQHQSADGSEASGDEGSVQPAGGGEHRLDDNAGEGDRGERDSPQRGREQRDDDPQDRPSHQVDPEKLEQLKALAAEVGVDFDGERVTTRDRVNFRAERRELKEKLSVKEADLQARFDRATASLEDRYASAVKLQEAIDSRDFDQIAKEAGYETFGAMSVAHVQRRLSPDQQEMAKLRGELVAEKRERAAWQERQKERQAEAQRADSITEYKQDLTTELRDHSDPAIADFAREPSFVDMVFTVQQQHWDGQQTLPTNEAVNMVINELRGTYSRMNRFFGNQAASSPEKQPTNGAHSIEKPGRKPLNVSHKEAADVSARARTDVLDEEAWVRKWAPEIKNSETQG
jgi:hypothetical protein